MSTEYGSFGSDLSDDSVNSKSSITTSTTDFSSCLSSPQSELITAEKLVKDGLADVSEYNDLFDYDEKTDPFLGYPPSPPKFPGKLVNGEKWRMCPYDNSHIYISTQYATHLYNCRNKYLDDNGMNEENADIVTCMYEAMHHGPKAQLMKHELNCKKAGLYFSYLDVFIERQRYTKYKELKEAENREMKMRMAMKRMKLKQEDEHGEKYGDEGANYQVDAEDTYEGDAEESQDEAGGTAQVYDADDEHDDDDSDSDSGWL